MENDVFLKKYSWVILNEPWTLSLNNIEYARSKVEQGRNVTGVGWGIIFRQNQREYFQLQLLFGMIDLEAGELDNANEHFCRARNSCCCSDEEERWVDLILAITAWYQVLKKAPTPQWDRGKMMLEELFSVSKNFIEEQRRDFKTLAIFEPKNIYPWLFDCKRKSHLVSPAMDIKSDIWTIPKTGGFNVANKRLIEKKVVQLSKTIEISQDPMEVGEGLVECGLASYQSGNMRDAVRYFEQATLKYPPQTHCQAVAGWLLGAVYLKCGWESEAQKQWKAAIETFEDAALEAQNKNDKDLVVWYRDTIDVMVKAMRYQATKNIQKV